MPTKYNIELSIEPNITNMPQELYDGTRDIFRTEGLLGKKHVNHFGRMFESHDESCSRLIKGHFDIFYRYGMNMTLREMHENAKLTTSRFDESGQEAIDMTEEIIDLFEKAEPFLQFCPGKCIRKCL